MELGDVLSFSPPFITLHIYGTLTDMMGTDKVLRNTFIASVVHETTQKRYLNRTEGYEIEHEIISLVRAARGQQVHPLHFNGVDGDVCEIETHFSPHTKHIWTIWLHITYSSIPSSLGSRNIKVANFLVTNKNEATIFEQIYIENKTY